MSREAVVIGGGLAGTLAMVALLDHVDLVTVVERDRFPREPAFRKGVPQARHLHVLLSSGQRALDRLLPGTGDALTEAGAHRLENPRDMIAHRSGGWERRYHEGRHSYIICTRPLLDHVVRLRAMERAAASRTRVEVLEATDVTALLGDSGRVTGVRIRPRDGEREERELHAGLVVDASGRGSHSPDWLDALGHRAPRLETVDAGLTYATRMFRLPDPPNGGVVIQHGRRAKTAGVLLPVENDAWLLTAGGVGGVQPPMDDEGFVEFATTFGHPLIHELIKSAEPLSPVFGFRATSNRRRH
jgi:flavin-dependent dehydrogenase